MNVYAGILCWGIQVTKNIGIQHLHRTYNCAAHVSSMSTNQPMFLKGFNQINTDMVWNISNTCTM